ncbi:uncharacterized protein LOC119727119 [Patiria miniata]|uniref:Uncharacterized protein n=1 Tax=Patiria miniata TaxID=46514 RepID=A0A913ZTY9_PATMI|nr:uncharacterized protein LOC119727119 [Patiria miniata]
MILRDVGIWGKLRACLNGMDVCPNYTSDLYFSHRCLHHRLHASSSSLLTQTSPSPSANSESIRLSLKHRPSYVAEYKSLATCACMLVKSCSDVAAFPAHDSDQVWCM